MSSIPETHRATSPESVACAAITISDTRTLENDTGGGTVVAMLSAAGHQIVGREIVRDEPAQIRELLRSLTGRGDVQAILITGGTGLSSRSNLRNRHRNVHQDDRRLR